MNKKLAPLAVVLAGTLWGLISTFVRHFSALGFSSLQIALLRFAIATVLLGILIPLQDPHALQIHLKDLWCFVGTGVVGLVLCSWGYFTAIQLSEVSIAVVLMYTAPIFVILLSAVLFKEEITPLKVVALVLTFLGTVLVAGLLGGGYALTPRVFLIGLLGGVGYGLYSIFDRFALQRGYHSMTINLYTALFAALGLLFLCRPLEIVEKLSPWVLLWGVVMSVACTVVPYVMYTWGLERMESGKASILTTVEPLVGAILGIALYHESHGPVKLLGMGLILAAVILLNVGGHHHHHHHHHRRRML